MTFEEFQKLPRAQRRKALRVFARENGMRKRLFATAFEIVDYNYRVLEKLETALKRAERNSTK